VPDIASAKQYLLEHGCALIEDHGLSFYVLDPNGVLFDVIQEASSKGG
jgi:hypothetical protein